MSHIDATCQCNWLMLNHHGCEYQNIDIDFFFSKNLIDDGAAKIILRKKAICIDSEFADDEV